MRIQAARSDRWAFFTALWLSALGLAYGQVTTNVLIPYEGVWKIAPPPTIPATNWMMPDFSDTNWISGSAPLGFPANEFLAEGLTMRTVFAAQGEPFYLRTSFELAASPADPEMELRASILMDDGIVIYINGQEKLRMNMPLDIPIKATTFALVAEANTNALLLLPKTVLRAGMNTIAVELHQSSTTSSDAVFALKLFTRKMKAAEIVTQPTNVTAVLGKRFSMSVTATGSDLSYQWYRNRVPISGATNPVYSVANASYVLQDSIYHVVVSNAVSVVRSSDAHLTVVPDLYPPHLISAVVKSNLVVGASTNTVVMVQFDEAALMSGATNLTNYTFTRMRDGMTIPLTEGYRPRYNGSQVLVASQVELQFPEIYKLEVCNLADSYTNTMAQPERVGVSFDYTLLNSRQVWKYANPLDFPEAALEACSALGEAWRAPDFDDRSWPEGQGVFYWMQNEALFTPCLGEFVTPLTHFNNVRSLLFRTRFSLSLPGKYEFLFRHLIGDGAAFYLNGSELYRYNLPSGTIDCGTTPASTNKLECLTSPAAACTNLVSGTNTLAVQLHCLPPTWQSPRSVIFGTEVIGRWTPLIE